MGLVTDIVATYRTPRRVVRHRIGPEPDEGRALVTLMLACGLIFVAQWPRLSREAFESGHELQMLIGAALLGWLFFMPLVFYVLSGVVGVVLRLAGGAGGYPVRVATFWALLAAAPLWLLWGLVAGFVGPSVGFTLTGGVALGAFLVFWGFGLAEAAFPKGVETT
ncbi:YIP1 family protein [Celeribacter arenosi]|uniref:YIP1 family protein n=1 Tax=Celeribacter arenosi TaxID=792649 RepID=A0ABP7KFY9_9RHOB